MLEGTLIAESIRPGTTLDGIALTVTRITRHTPADTTADQPGTWTNIDFEAADADADALAGVLAAALDEPGWYVEFRSGQETFVVFRDRVFRYPRGDVAGREEAAAYGRTFGVPETQLDWPV
jgi:hypothetical protein